MKTLIFNGSPRENGCSSYLVNRLGARLQGEVRVIKVYGVKVAPCNDCRYCWKHIGCCIEDDMQQIYSYICESDHIVIASPIHFSELTGVLLSVLSRLQMFYSAKNFLKTDLLPMQKKGAVILCGGGSGGAQKAEDTAKLLLRSMSAVHNATIMSLHTDMVSSQDDERAKSAVDELAVKWNWQA
jgi:multimeric flavodoxin WrbA